LRSNAFDLNAAIVT